MNVTGTEGQDRATCRRATVIGNPLSAGLARFPSSLQSGISTGQSFGSPIMDPEVRADAGTHKACSGFGERCIFFFLFPFLLRRRTEPVHRRFPRGGVHLLHLNSSTFGDPFHLASKSMPCVARVTPDAMLVRVCRIDGLTPRLLQTAKIVFL